MLGPQVNCLASLQAHQELCIIMLRVKWNLIIVNMANFKTLICIRHPSLVPRHLSALLTCRRYGGSLGRCPTMRIIHRVIVINYVPKRMMIYDIIMMLTTYLAPATLAARAACSLTVKDSTPRQPPRYRLNDIYITIKYKPTLCKDLFYIRLHTVAPWDGGTSRLSSMGEEHGATRSQSHAMLWKRGETAAPISSLVLRSRILFQT